MAGHREGKFQNSVFFHLEAPKAHLRLRRETAKWLTAQFPVTPLLNRLPEAMALGSHRELRFQVLQPSKAHNAQVLGDHLKTGHQ